MKFRIVYVIFFFIGLSTCAQDTLNFKTVNITTYQAYTNKDWKTVIKIGNLALKQNIDYYYLRMRLGIAYFEKKNYRKSIVHFEKAMSMNREEVIATEYLYHAYKNIGDDIQAVKTLKKSDTKFANKLFRQQSIFQNIYTFYSSRIYNANNIKDASLSVYQAEKNKQKKPVYVEQYIPKSYFNSQLGATIRFSPSWRFNVSFQNFQVKKEQYILDPFKETSSNTKITQNQWNFNNTFRLSNRLKASVFLSSLSQKYNYLKINTDIVPVSYEKQNNVKNSNLLVGIAIRRQQTYFDIGIVLSSMTTKFITNQVDLELEIYPFGNQKLISKTIVSFLQSDTTKRKTIFSQSIIYSPHKRIILSLTGNWGEMYNWNTNNGYAIYNGIFSLKEMYQFQITARIVKDLYVKLYYQYMSNNSNIWSKSLFPEDSKDEPQIVNKTKFNTHSIIGGLIWEF